MFHRIVSQSLYKYRTEKKKADYRAIADFTPFPSNCFTEMFHRKYKPFAPILRCFCDITINRFIRPYLKRLFIQEQGSENAYKSGNVFPVL